MTPAPTYYVSNYGPNVLVSASRVFTVLAITAVLWMGSLAPRPAGAIQHYQVDNGLPVTGRLDSRTLASLGI